MGYFKSFLFLMVIILIFALYQSISILLYDPAWFMKVVALIVVFAIVYLGSHRNTYLPFLGPTVFPVSLVKEPAVVDNKNATQTTLFVNVPDGTKVAYWAAKASTDVIFEDPYAAYDQYTNAGVAVVKNNQAKLIIDCPSSYKIPTGRTLKPHVHYRVLYPNGIMGSVQTLFINC